ncbi:MAG: T9SS type A sorting domain-containing protein [Prevotellaceae bacterium]|jgi:endoglucanase Acf2|nr:T9SS type A sorting domain-containing protein [Prevotellaceae bacterium]
MRNLKSNLLIAFAIFAIHLSMAAIIPVGNGSYTTTYPGADAGGRNQYPSGTPQLSGNALGKPVPTNDWWSALLKQNHVSNLFSYPFTLKTVSGGLVVSYIPRGVIDDLLPVTVGVSALAADKATVCDHSDWTVSMQWDDGAHRMQATAGIGMPFIYFEKQSSDIARVQVTSGTVTISSEVLIIENAKNGADFAVYAPAGSTWSKDGGTYTSTLSGKNYWSLAFLPMSGISVSAAAEAYKQHAYVFPTQTRANYSYDPVASVVRTDFQVAVDVKEGTGSTMLLGLLPHHWANLAAASPQPQGYSYPSIRGELKTVASNSFSVENKFHGVLPTLPFVDTLSVGFQLSTLNAKLTAMQDDEIGTWTDSYNDGQLLNRLVQSARIAGEVGNIEAQDSMLNTIQERVEDWLHAEASEVAFLFYYNDTWTALIGYPAGHGQDNNLNDHHFHWGYFIHAAAFLEYYRPGWAADWGDMINLLIRDAASFQHDDALFPYLRNFSPYAGHSWANGFATFPQGNDQESTSESMQFNASLIHWGAVTNNTAIRDLGIYLYTTELTAIEEYWFDVYDRNFPATQQYSLVSRVWGNDLDNQTFWTGDIAASYGIELYPIHGGSLYLGYNHDYAKKLWQEIKTNTTITANDNSNPNLWHDIMWQYAAFTSPSEAVALYNANNLSRALKFGVSDAQTYYWLHAMNVLGKVDASVTADHPIAAVFDHSGKKTYTAQNYGNTPLAVHFSDGFQLDVPARKLLAVSSGSGLPDVTITSPADYSKFEVGLPITLSATANDMNGVAISQVDFYNGTTLIDTDLTAPYSIQWTPAAGSYKLVAKATNVNQEVGISDTVNIVVSEFSSCRFTATEAQQGAFSTGYMATFEAFGGDVTVTYKLLDTDKVGVVAYLWQPTPFSERPLTAMGNQTFSATLTNQTIGATLRLGCKFAYAGGMSVTAYYDYVVGSSCGSAVDNTTAATCLIYPNPTTALITIQYATSIEKVALVDMFGRKTEISPVAAEQATYDLSAVPAGLYLLQITDCNLQTGSYKIVKE